MKLRWLLGLFLLPAVSFALDGEALRRLLPERAQSVVFLEGFVQREESRQPLSGLGLVADDQGLIMFLGEVFPSWMPPDTFRDLRVHLANSSDDGYPATYLGVDFLHGFHFVRVAEEGRAQLIPAPRWGFGQPQVGDELWGLALSDDSLDYLAFFGVAHLAVTRQLPLWMGFTTSDVAAPGAPVFDQQGRLVGWTATMTPEVREFWHDGDYFLMSTRSPNASSRFFLAAELFAELRPPPASPLDDPRPWVGIVGTQPVDRETARFLGLEDQGLLVISEVVPGSPAATAGIQPRDIILGIDGQRLPRLKPDPVVQSFVSRRVIAHQIGDTISFELLRDKDTLTVDVVTTTPPKDLRAAQREFVDTLGLTVREVVLSDALARRRQMNEMAGAIVSFVRPNSPAASAGLEENDWVQEIDGQPVDAFATARDRLLEIAASDREEYVLLVNRNNQTNVLRVRRK